MTKSKPFVCLILGPAGAGKTTTSRLLAKRFDRCAVIEVDRVRHMVTSGRTSPTKPEGRDQLMLSTENTVALAKNFTDRGINVIVDDVVAGKPRFDRYLELLAGYRVVPILLLPNRETVSVRDRQRRRADWMGQRALDLHDLLTKRVTEETRWHVLDTSNQTPDESVATVYGILTSHVERRASL